MRTGLSLMSVRPSLLPPAAAPGALSAFRPYADDSLARLGHLTTGQAMCRIATATSRTSQPSCRCPCTRRMPAGVLRGESTPFYLYNRDAQRRIRARIPDAKLIVVLRTRSSARTRTGARHRAPAVLGYDPRVLRLPHAGGQPACPGRPARLVLPARESRADRRGGPVLADLAVPDLGVRHARPAHQGKAMELHLPRRGHPAVRHRHHAVLPVAGPVHALPARPDRSAAPSATCAGSPRAQNTTCGKGWARSSPTSRSRT